MKSVVLIYSRISLCYNPWQLPPLLLLCASEKSLASSPLQPLGHGRVLNQSGVPHLSSCVTSPAADPPQLSELPPVCLCFTQSPKLDAVLQWHPNEQEQRGIVRPGQAIQQELAFIPAGAKPMTHWMWRLPAPQVKKRYPQTHMGHFCPRCRTWHSFPSSLL